MRTKLCLNTYDNYKNLKFGEIPTTYYNKFYKKTMDLTVCDFYWASSRKSYLPCGEHCDVYSYDAIKYTLLSGARLINLDIYASDEGVMPIVREQTPMPKVMSGLLTELEVDKCFKVIKKYAWLMAPNYPLILYLNIHTNNKTVLHNLAKSLHSNFHQHFLNKKYSFDGRNGLHTLGQIPIKEMFGNIAIVSDMYPAVGTLDEFINGYVSQESGLINQIDYTDSTEAYGGILSKKSDVSEMINNNRFNLTFVNSSKDGRPNITHTSECMLNLNFRNPKSDLYNANAEDVWKFGVQFVLMNYQFFDENMQKYLNQFTNSSLILKPDELRYIPQPPKPVIYQNQHASYAPRKVEQKGWYSFTI
jgi:hypothetical protein